MSHQITRLWRGVFYALFILTLAGCATAPKEAPFIPPVFPAAPDAPRFIYERTLSFSDNVEQASSVAERLRLFAVGEKKGAKALVKPFGVAVHRGRVYVTDTAQRLVVMFDIPGGRYVEIGTDKPGQLTKPMGIDVSSQGEVFVSDMTLRRVLV